MDVKLITELIASLGFPIACVIGLGYFVWQLYKQSVKREDTLMEVNNKAIETIAKYASKLDEIKADVAEIKEDVNSIISKG